MLNLPISSYPSTGSDFAKASSDRSGQGSPAKCNVAGVKPTGEGAKLTERTKFLSLGIGSYHAMLEEQGHPFVKKIYQYINGLVLITGIVPLLPIGILPDAPRPWYLCLVYMGWFWQPSCEHHIIPFVFWTIVFTLLSVTMEFIKEWLNSYGLRNESVKSSKGESYLENKDIHVL